MAYFPAWTPLYDLVKQKYEAMVQHINEVNESLKHIEDPKEFSLALGKQKIPSGLFFAMRKSGVTVREFLENCNLKQLESYGYKPEKVQK